MKVPRAVAVGELLQVFDTHRLARKLVQLLGHWVEIKRIGPVRIGERRIMGIHQIAVAIVVADNSAGIIQGGDLSKIWSENALAYTPSGCAKMFSKQRVEQLEECQDVFFRPGKCCVEMVGHHLESQNNHFWAEQCGYSE